MTPTRRLIVFVTLAYCLALYPAVLRFTTRTGFDAPIYWRAARGDLTPAPANKAGLQSGWVYSDHLLPALKPAAHVSYPAFLLVLHTLNSIGVACLMAACLRRTDAYPVMAGACAFVVGIKASDIVAGGNITGLLCGLSLTPWGAFIAAAVKPQYAVALVLHAALWCASQQRHAAPCDHQERQLRDPGTGGLSGTCWRCGEKGISTHHNCEHSYLRNRIKRLESPGEIGDGGDAHR